MDHPTAELASGQVSGSSEEPLAVGAGFQPWVDGDVLRSQPADGLAVGSAAGVPFLAGTNEHEMNLWRVLEPGLRSLDEAGLAVRVPRLVGEAAAELVAAYRAAKPSGGSGPSAEALATTMQDAWLSFARTGNPGWPAYDPSTRATMLLGEECDVADDPLPAERCAWDGLPTA